MGCAVRPVRLLSFSSRSQSVVTRLRPVVPSSSKEVFLVEIYTAFAIAATRRGGDTAAATRRGGNTAVAPAASHVAPVALLPRGTRERRVAPESVRSGPLWESSA